LIGNKLMLEILRLDRSNRQIHVIVTSGTVKHPGANHGLQPPWLKRCHERLSVHVGAAA
jgi:hypothetical protein